MEEQTYTLEQIVDAIMRGGEDAIQAIKYADREMLEDVIKDFLT